MTRIAILPYGPSDSVNALVAGLTEALPNNRIVKLRREGSTFQGRQGDLIIDWGNSNLNAGQFDRIVGNGRKLNSPSQIASASNKVNTFRQFADANVPTVDWTTERAVAQRWFDAGEVVYARTRLQGHSGEGIVVCTTQDLPDLGDVQVDRQTLIRAPLYTKGITEQRREFRVHVMNGQIIYTQQKKRVDDYRNNPNYSNIVRNHHTGWIYATQNIAINAAGRAAAIAAVQATGLDFGAVDIITRGNNAWVLEVNTAPGLSGTNLTNYVEHIAAIFEGREVRNVVAEEGQVAEAGLEALQQEIAQEVAPVEPQRPAPQREPAAARAVAPAPARGQQARPVDGCYYVAEVEGLEPARTVVRYVGQTNVFYAVGWEVPIQPTAVNIIRHLEL